MTGVYYAAAELSARGYIATLTARNSPTVDMIVSSPDLKKSFTIQVKANKPKEDGGTQSFWLLSKEAKTTISRNLVYVFVNLKRDGKPDFYIAKSRTVSEKLEVSHTKSGEWYSFPRDNKQKDRWDILT